jgi:bifunctional non-homologous end joining protein LigD
MAPGEYKTKRSFHKTPAVIESITQGKKSAMPEDITPMLATLSENVTNNPKYIYEVKWDGYRIISYVKKKSVRLISRGGKNYTDRYPLVVDALKNLNRNMILDGEMVVFDNEGKPHFNAVQLYNGHNTPISYYVFDILHLDGYDLKELPLTERKTILRQVVEGSGIIKYSDSFDDGEGLFKLMQEKGWEGIVAKNKNSAYLEGNRSHIWLKFPVKKIDEFVIGGWAESDKARSFRSILFGAYNHGELQWLGRSGGGFKQKEMPHILKKLKSLEIERSPFVNKVLDTKGANIHWVMPMLVANFEYSEMTESGRIRKPATWKGFREDKDPKDVIIPVVKQFNETTSDKLTNSANKKKTVKNKSALKTKSSINKKHTYLNKDSNWAKVDEEQKGATWHDFDMQNCTIPVHNLERELWTGVPKGRLLIYYSEIANYILPYIKDRPQSLNLKLTHAGGPRTFIKDMENRQPDCAEIFTDKRRVKKTGKRAQIDYLVCNNLETLIYLVDVGCVDVNTWASRTQHIEEPDYLWLDLDPTIPEDLKGKQLENIETKGFEKAIDVAIAAKKILDKRKLTGFVKTSGKSGLHIYIPCSGIPFSKARALAYIISDEVHLLVPKISTREESKDLRGDKVYIDAGQNDYADTLAAPYAVRPYHEPLVSTPLERS